MAFRPEKLPDFLEATYRLDADDQTWLADVLEGARAVWGRGGPAHGAICDASDPNAFRVERVHVIDFPRGGVELLEETLDLFTPAYVARTFRSIMATTTRKVSLPELGPLFEGMGRLGFPDGFGVNGFEPTGPLVFLSFWMPASAEPPAAERAIYRRMAHHLAAAHRYRRRLRAGHAGQSRRDPTEGAEAILDARRRVVHAVGEAATRAGRDVLITASRARDLAHSTKGGAREGLRRWSPLVSARWTLVDSFESSGARYVVARENQTQVRGLAALSDRERQVVACLAIGQSTKEIAYALGISGATVRVLIVRATGKMGVGSRAALLDHPEVRTAFTRAP